MKVVFISNYMNHHQLYVSQEFVEQLGDDNYVFIACEPFETARLSVGYEDMNNKYDYIIRAYENKKTIPISKANDKNRECYYFLVWYRKVMRVCNQAK